MKIEINALERRGISTIGALVIIIIIASAGGIAFTAGEPVTGTIPLNAVDGPQIDVVFSSQSELDVTNSFPDNSTIDVSTNNGNATFSGSAGSYATINAGDITGTTTTVSSIDTGGGQVSINPADKDKITVSGGVSEVEFSEMALDANATEITYSASGSGTITVTGLPASTQWGAESAGSLVDSGTTDSSGVTTISVPAATNKDLNLFALNTPTVTPVAPLDGTKLNDPTQTLTVDVDDQDFEIAEDSLTVEFYADGQQIDTKTVSSPSEVSTEHTWTTGGDHTWSATVTDSIGNSDETATQNVGVTAELQVYNESQPDKLVNSTSIDVTFYGGNETITRSSSDGTISFDGLPLDRRFEAEVSADGYESRTVVIPSLVEQESVWLLPDSAESIKVRFRLEDATGTFSQRSELYIEKPITVNNQTEYRIITSREFGVDGVTTVLDKDTRYDLRIRNQAGDNAQLATYSATVSETVTLQPDVAAVQKPEAQNIGYEVDYSADNEQISIEYIDPADKTESLTVSVKSRDGETTLRAPQTYTNTSSLSLSVPTDGKLNKTYLVNMSGSRGSQQIEISQPVGPDQRNIVPRELDPTYGNILGIMSVLLVAGVFSTLNAGVGALVTALFGGVLWFFGILSGVASGGSILLAIGIASLNAFNSR